MTLPSDASVQCDYLDLPSTFLTYETEFCRYFMNFKSDFGFYLVCQMSLKIIIEMRIIFHWK